MYYKAQQGDGYTLVENRGKGNDFTVFHVNTSDNSFRFTLQYYECKFSFKINNINVDLAGKWEDKCSKHPLCFEEKRLTMEYTGSFLDRNLYFIDYAGRVVDVNTDTIVCFPYTKTLCTPHIYVVDSESGVDFDVKHIPFYLMENDKNNLSDPLNFELFNKRFVCCLSPNN
jgi:hypothetical protein